jgi:hypothetical protein
LTAAAPYTRGHVVRSLIERFIERLIERFIVVVRIALASSAREHSRDGRP